MTLTDLHDERNVLQERIHVALASNDKILANSLLKQFNDVHWQIRDAEEAAYHEQDVRHDLAMMEMSANG